MIEEIFVADNISAASFWLQLSWVDKRLKWNPLMYSGRLVRKQGSLWEPFIYVANSVTDSRASIITRTDLTVDSSGLVRLGLKLRGSYQCNMEIKAYPYDTHACQLNFTAGTSTNAIDLTKLHESGVDVKGYPEGYTVRSQAGGVKQSTISKEVPSLSSSLSLPIRSRLSANPIL